jgi:hypothetical protein
MHDQPDPPATLASDAEREHSVAVLRDAVVEGRLTLEAFSERVGQVLTARTHRDLTALTADLPSPVSLAPEATPARHQALFSQLVRGGAWELPARSSWRSVFGTINLDLREVRLAAPEVELTIYNLFGTVTVLVPPGIAVEVDGGGAFASQVIQPPPWPAPQGAPRLKIHVSGPGGTLHVRSSESRPRRGMVLGRGSP